jgi:hypothetical protein
MGAPIDRALQVAQLVKFSQKVIDFYGNGWPSKRKITKKNPKYEP